MIHILKREFIDSFKSVRSILIILFITYISYKSANVLDNNPELINEFIEIGGTESSAYTASVAIVILLLGYLFVFATSHDLVNKETELKTIRLLVTKVSRFDILLGKLLGTMLFWIVLTSISFGILSIYAGTWFPKDFIQIIILLFYIVNLVLLISTAIPSTRLTMFLGIILGLSLPFIGFIAMDADQWYWLPFKYILPYNYLDGSFIFTLIPFMIGTIYFLISVFIMQKRDL